MLPSDPSRVAAPGSSLYSFTTSMNEAPCWSFERASWARRQASSRVRVTVGAALFAPAYLTSACFTTTFAGSFGRRSC
jgi:hypothetical protein